MNSNLMMSALEDIKIVRIAIDKIERGIIDTMQNECVLGNVHTNPCNEAEARGTFVTFSEFKRMPKSSRDMAIKVRLANGKELAMIFREKVIQSEMKEKLIKLAEMAKKEQIKFSCYYTEMPNGIIEFVRFA